MNWDIDSKRMKNIQSSLLGVPVDNGRSRKDESGTGTGTGTGSGSGTTRTSGSGSGEQNGNNGFNINIIEANKSKPNTYYSPGSPIPRPNPLENSGLLNSISASRIKPSPSTSNTSSSNPSSSSSTSKFNIPSIQLPALKLTPPPLPMNKIDPIPEQNLGKNSLYVPLKTEELGWEEGGIYWAGRYSYPVVNLYGGEDDHVVGQYR